MDRECIKCSRNSHLVISEWWDEGLCFPFSFSKYSSFPHFGYSLDEWRYKHYPNRVNKTTRKSLACQGQALGRAAGGDEGWEVEAAWPVGKEGDQFLPHTRCVWGEQGSEKEGAQPTSKGQPLSTFWPPATGRKWRCPGDKGPFPLFAAREPSYVSWSQDRSVVADDSREVPRVSYNKSLLILISPKAKVSLKSNGTQAKPSLHVHFCFTITCILCRLGKT